MDRDTLLVSVGLIPENELSGNCGCASTRSLQARSSPAPWRRPGTGSSPAATWYIHDLVDYVSDEAALAGAAAGRYATGHRGAADNVRLQPATNVAYCVPHTVSSHREQTVYLRVRQPLDPALLRLSTPTAAPCTSASCATSCPPRW